MMLLVGGATKTIARYTQSPHLGHLLQPRNGNTMASVLKTGLPWAADNDCYKIYRPAAIMALWSKVAGHPRCLFAVMPDKPEDAAETLRLFSIWRPLARELALPVALVAQNGQEALPVPWDDIDCLFIGGDTAWKCGPHAFGLAQEAKRRSKWLHVGRVNTIPREALCWKMAADSFDGTQYSMYPEVYLSAALERLANPPMMFDFAA